MTRPTCTTCAFWAGERVAVDSLGTCRVRAPGLGREEFLPDGDDKARIVRGEWPWVSADDWCGEHQAVA